MIKVFSCIHKDPFFLKYLGNTEFISICLLGSYSGVHIFFIVSQELFTFDWTPNQGSPGQNWLHRFYNFDLYW